MNYNDNIKKLITEVIKFNSGDPERIHHLMKVFSFANTIANNEKTDAYTKYIACSSALVHDIGIRPTEQLFGKSTHELQEKFGPVYAQKLLESSDYSDMDIHRICYITGNHHTFSKIDDLDFQILVEADLLVNFHEEKLPINTIQQIYEKIFRTSCGCELCNLMYFISAN